jgi:hypothetical protein
VPAEKGTGDEPRWATQKHPLNHAHAAARSLTHSRWLSAQLWAFVSNQIGLWRVTRADVAGGRIARIDTADKAKNDAKQRKGRTGPSSNSHLPSATLPSRTLPAPP